MSVRHHLGVCSALCLVAFASCTDSSEVADIPFRETVSLQAVDSVCLDAYDILDPQDMQVTGDSVWIVDGSAESLVFLLSVEGACLAKGIHIGNGPGEVLEITSLHKSGGEMRMYDARKGQISRVEVSDSSLRLVPLASQLRLFEDAVLLPDNNRMVLPVAQRCSYVLQDLAGNRLDSLAYYPPKPDKASGFTHSLACTGRLAVTADGRRFARSLVYDGGIDFFALEKNASLSHLVRIESFGMDYEVLDMGQPVPGLSRTSRVGYRSLTASADTYYALFSAVLASEWREGSAEVQSFNLDGIPLCRYVLDRKLTHIAVSSDNSMLLGTGMAGEDSMYLFVYSLGG